MTKQLILQYNQLKSKLTKVINKYNDNKVR